MMGQSLSPQFGWSRKLGVDSGHNFGMEKTTFCQLPHNPHYVFMLYHMYASDAGIASCARTSAMSGQKIEPKDAKRLCSAPGLLSTVSPYATNVESSPFLGKSLRPSRFQRLRVQRWACEPPGTVVDTSGQVPTIKKDHLHPCMMLAKGDSFPRP